MENKPFIHVQNLSYSYVGEDDQPIPVLKNLSLDIREGEYVVILGHNGSGKSTFAKLLNLVIDDYTFAEGTITVDGVEVMSPDLTDEEARIVALLEQHADGLHINTLVTESDIPINRLSALLFELELRGIVRPLAGSCYKLIR